MTLRMCISHLAGDLLVAIWPGDERARSASTFCAKIFAANRANAAETQRLILGNDGRITMLALIGTRSSRAYRPVEKSGVCNRVG